jgi:hypothetical protein
VCHGGIPAASAAHHLKDSPRLSLLREGATMVPTRDSALKLVVIP